MDRPIDAAHRRHLREVAMRRSKKLSTNLVVGQGLGLDLDHISDGVSSPRLRLGFGLDNNMNNNNNNKNIVFSLLASHSPGSIFLSPSSNHQISTPSHQRVMTSITPNGSMSRHFFQSNWEDLGPSLSQNSSKQNQGSKSRRPAPINTNPSNSSLHLDGSQYLNPSFNNNNNIYSNSGPPTFDLTRLESFDEFGPLSMSSSGTPVQTRS
jgi:hypothetical protein